MGRITTNEEKEKTKSYRAVLYFQDVFFTLEATLDDPASFLLKSDDDLMSVFEKEIRPIISKNLGSVEVARVGSRLGGDGWGYVEFVAEGENFHTAPRLFVYEHPKLSAHVAVMKSYEEEKKSWYR
jgi:hypothetical protein